MTVMSRNLKEKVQSNAVAQTSEAPSIVARIQAMETQFSMAMPRGMEAAQLVRDALTSVKMTPKLAQCDSLSVLGGLMTCAQLGLRPGVLGHAWLLPFYNKKAQRFEAQLVIGYQGLIELAHRSGQIKSLIARTVYANDTFDVDYGLTDSLVHKPAMQGAKGDPVAYYAIAKFTTGGHAFIVINHDEMCEYRDKYAMAKTKTGFVVGPWRDQFEGMAHKTCVRQLSKWMPKSTEMASAIEADGSIRFNVDTNADIPTSVEHPDGVLEGEVVEPGDAVTQLPDLQEAPDETPPTSPMSEPFAEAEARDAGAQR